MSMQEARLAEHISTDPIPSRDVPSAPGVGLYRRVWWHIMPWLLLTYIVNYIDRSNVGFAKLGFMHALGFDSTVFGIGAGVFYAGYMMFEIPSNLMLARIGVRKTLLRIMVLWAVCSGLMAMMRGPATYYLARFLLGASEAGLFPGILLYLTYWVPVSYRTRFTAVFMAALPTAGIISGPISGAIMHSMNGTLGLQNWQWLFILEGLPALVLGVVVYFKLSDSPSTASWLSEAERAQVAKDLEADRTRLGSRGHRYASFGAALRSPRFYMLAFMAIALIAGSGNIGFWLPTIIKEAGIHNAWTIGVLSMIPFAVGVTAQQLVAWHADRKNERRWHAAVCAIVAACGWFLLPLVAGNPTLALSALVLTAAGTFATMGPFWSLPGLYLGPKAAAGGIALITTLAGIGGLISPVIVGWLKDVSHSLAAGQIYLGALMLLGGVTVLAMGRPESTDRH